MAALSGTCNLVDPDRSRRDRNLTNLAGLIRISGELRTPVVTLCTGSRDPEDMWRRHPDNHRPETWADLVNALEQLLPAAEEAGVVLGIEPEPANVIDSTRRARKLMDELRSPQLRIVFDAANLVTPESLGVQARIISEAVDLLGPEIVLAHAKDIRGGENPGYVAAGHGKLDYELYLKVLRRGGFDGPLVLHGLQEHEVPGAVVFLKTELSRLGARGGI